MYNVNNMKVYPLCTYKQCPVQSLHKDKKVQLPLKGKCCHVQSSLYLSKYITISILTCVHSCLDAAPVALYHFT